VSDLIAKDIKESFECPWRSLCSSHTDIRLLYFPQLSWRNTKDSLDRVVHRCKTSGAATTVGLVNPDGFLAVVPNTYPIEVLYISKALNSDYVPPTSYPICPASIPNGNFNDDVEVVRIATTTDFIHFTDITLPRCRAFCRSPALHRVF
jgi:hypothetical protein